MAPPVEKIIISGFRGILQPLEVDFTKGSGPRSMIIYGKNGTGKSSLTDAWEWFHKGNVDHLRREGAGPSSFPHRDADAGGTYVVVEFEDDEVDDAKLTFDAERKTIPKAQGSLEDFRSRVPHPFYIRFEDLKAFVYQTKSEKYDKLAHLMGFEPQVDFQKGLRRTLSQLGNELEKRKHAADQRCSDLKQLLGLSDVQEERFFGALNERLGRNDLDSAQSLDDLEGARHVLKEKVESDPRARRVRELRDVRATLRKAVQNNDSAEALLTYASQARAFKQKEQATVDTLLVQLYEAGEGVVNARSSTGETVDHCPLCDQPYEGDLAAHIKDELEGLRGLRTARQDLRKARKAAQDAARTLCNLPRTLAMEEEVEFQAEDASLESICEQAARVASEAEVARSAVNAAVKEVTVERLEVLQRRAETIRGAVEAYEQDRSALLDAADKKREALKDDSGRKQLVEDYGVVRDACDQWSKLQAACSERDRLQGVYDEFEAVVESYVQKNSADVEQRFSEISEDVQTYFEILEEDTEGISQPALRLLTDKDRAVMLEVEFHDQRTSPAYKYLSESQLNSFGLAIFLASAKRFNADFPFLVLDDVINSFDGYKRLKLIDLLKDEMQNHQVLVLTHDRVWIKQIADQFPQWKRRRFKSWRPNYGPIDGDSAVGLDYVEQLLEEDRPESAGRELAAFLERQLQLLCELFGAMVKYNRHNEYTLSPLFTRFRVRVKGKLGAEHELTNAVGALEETSSFRNFCAHWKNPETPFTASEIGSVLKKWNAVDAVARCPDCHRFPRYDGSAFACDCGKTVLQK